MTEPLLIHIHVPKCAGSTVERHLTTQLGKSGVWIADKRSRKAPLGWFGRKYDANPPAHLAKIKALSGHFIGQSIEELFRERRIIRSIILREPESLMLSYYNFRMIRYIRRGEKPYSFSLFLNATRENYVSHFLLERWLELTWIDLFRLSPEQKMRLLDDALSSVDHIAQISETDALVETISNEIGISPIAPRQNTTAEKKAAASWQILRLSDLSDADRSRLQARTHFDRYLWRRWALKENITFNPERQNSFTRSEFVRPRYQCERRLARMLGGV